MAAVCAAFIASPHFAAAQPSGTALAYQQAIPPNGQPAPSSQGAVQLAWAADEVAAASRPSGGSLIAGVDFMLIRPRFSESIAFARGTQDFTGPIVQDMTAESIRFDYEPTGRLFVGYQWAESRTALTLTYWNVSADTWNNAVAGPGDFYVDPFGAVAGVALVLDPADPRVGTFVTDGDEVRTQTSVDLNVFDLDLAIPICTSHGNFDLTCIAGVRLADLDQYYASDVLAGGVVTRHGDYNVSFIGAGPHFGIRGNRYLGTRQAVSLYGALNTALLLGTYDVAFSSGAVGIMRGSQTEDITRLIPVLESELGVSANLTERLTLTGGWLFQSWWDLGTSGGNFGGFFSGADDGNIMAFDGLFVRGEFAY